MTDEPTMDWDLFIGQSNDAHARELLGWYVAERHAGGLHEFVPEYHRLQLERWIWDHRAELRGRTMDVGAQSPRRWLGSGYFTFGETDDVEADERGNLLQLPFEDASLDAALCTEVLEHCIDPPRALRELHRTLKPGGLLLASAPFLWPWHGRQEYPDFWRFTHQGWRLLLGEFRDVQVTACDWTDEARGLIDLVRRLEGMGRLGEVHGHTGYLVQARR